MGGAEQSFAVSAAALDDAAHTLRDKYDVLLDRIADRLLGMPAPGTPQWYAIFRDKPSAEIYHQRRSEVRAALTHRAGVSVTEAGFPASPIRQQKRVTRRTVDEAQLSIW